MFVLCRCNFMETFVFAILIILFGLVFDYTNGFHDAANVVSTVIATRVLAPATAIVLAGLLNTVGALHISGVVNTISTGIIQSSLSTPIVILAAILGAIIWNLATWYFGIPSSSSYALIGGLMGSSLMASGVKSIIWKGVLFKVLIPMVISPIIGFVIAFLLMKCLSFLTTTNKTKGREGLFAHLQIGSAGLVALAHGLNDAQKSMGLMTLGLFSAGFIANITVPLWVILSCALVMGLGTASGGMRIVRTVGFSITKLRPIQGFAVEMSASVVILSASFLGLPVSSTHMIVGSVTGVGAAKKLSSVQWIVIKKLLYVWALALPGASFVSALVWLIINLIV